MSRVIQVSCLLSAFGLLGCGMMLDLAEDPQVVETGPWRCLGKVTPALSTKPTSLVRVRTCDFVSNCTETVAGMTGQLCHKADVGCRNPIMTGIPGTNGELSFQAPTGFDGFLKLSAPMKHCMDFPADSTAIICGMAITLQGCVNPENRNDPLCNVPTHAESMLFFNPPVNADMTKPIDLPLLSMASWPSVMQSGGVPQESLLQMTEGGNLFVSVKDCDGKPASGVTFSIPPQQNETFQMYVTNGLPTRDATATDSSGIGAFVGLTKGKFVEVSAQTPDGRLIGTVSVQADKLGMTYSSLPAE